MVVSICAEARGGRLSAMKAFFDFVCECAGTPRGFPVDGSTGCGGLCR